MALTGQQARKARIALQRFGLGPKRWGVARIGVDPVAAVKAELNTTGIALIDDASLPGYDQAVRIAQQGFNEADALAQAELRARVRKHLVPQVGFVERLVLFWSNHFSMSINKAETVRGLIGQVERQVIRRHVLGNFGDMLRGVITHPAMIQYLDNQDSIGPNSEIGRLWGVGYNENLAREILELHTVGSGAGYTELDVTNFARILTGWSYVRGWESDYGYNGGTDANRGRFIYRANWHEPGEIRVMGKTYPAVGQRQAQLVMADLVRKRATAQHIAYKLVQHFITDTPTPELVDPVANAFHSTGGDLKATALALVDLPAAWTLPLTKIRTPYELEVARFRAINRLYETADEWAFVEPLRSMKHLPWSRPTPDGYPDETAYWIGPDAMTIRLDTAQLAAWMMRDYLPADPVTLARSMFDAALSSRTRQSIQAAGDSIGGYTVFFMSPEFQRR